MHQACRWPVWGCFDIQIENLNVYSVQCTDSVYVLVSTAPSLAVRLRLERTTLPPRKPMQVVIVSVLCCIALDQSGQD